MDVKYEIDRIRKLTRMNSLPSHWYIPGVKMEGNYYHFFKVCYPNSIEYRPRCIDQIENRQEMESAALEDLFSILLRVNTLER